MTESSFTWLQDPLPVRWKILDVEEDRMNKDESRYELRMRRSSKSPQRIWIEKFAVQWDKSNMNRWMNESNRRPSIDKADTRRLFHRRDYELQSEKMLHQRFEWTTRCSRTQSLNGHASDCSIRMDMQVTVPLAMNRGTSEQRGDSKFEWACKWLSH